MSPYRCYNPDCIRGTCPSCRYVRDLEARAASLAADTARRRSRSEAAVLQVLGHDAWRTKTEIARAAGLSDRGASNALERLVAQGRVAQAPMQRTRRGQQRWDGEFAMIRYQTVGFRLAPNAP